MNSNKHLNIVADMAADLFHAGHVNLLRQAKEYFSKTQVHLTVALHTDEQILSYKKRLPVISFENRALVLLACKYVDSVIKAPDEFDSKFIDQFDYLFHGDDLLQWNRELFEKFYKVVSQENKLIIVPYTAGISTTKLRNLINNGK